MRLQSKAVKVVCLFAPLHCICAAALLYQQNIDTMLLVNPPILPRMRAKPNLPIIGYVIAHTQHQEATLKKFCLIILLLLTCLLPQLPCALPPNFAY